MPVINAVRAWLMASILDEGPESTIMPQTSLGVEGESP